MVSARTIAFFLGEHLLARDVFAVIETLIEKMVPKRGCSNADQRVHAYRDAYAGSGARHMLYKFFLPLEDCTAPPSP
jgi:hypothetical protein